jgi:hypothetical protein
MLRILFLLLYSLPAIACPVSQDVMERLLSRPKLKAMVVSENGLTEKDFRDLLGRFKAYADPLLKTRGLVTSYHTDWQNEDQNAYTVMQGLSVTFLFTGGLLRAPLMTKDGFLYVTCHELGHHLGGFPKIPNQPWSSTEGEADYYATLRCMKDLMKGDPENAKAGSLDLPGSVKKSCRKMFSDEESVNICLRSTKAGEDTFRVLQAKDTGKADESLFTMWMMPALKTMDNHPDYDCRAETAFRGAVCTASGEMSDTDETVGACHKKNGNKIGARPRCWFRPGAE